MDAIIIDANVDEKHNATIKLPDVPPGNVRLEVRVVQDAPSEAYEPNSREWLRAKLKEAGLLVENPLSDEELGELEHFEELSDEEEDELGCLLTDPERSTLDLINEDREERF